MLALRLVFALLAAAAVACAVEQPVPTAEADMALVAASSTSYVSGHETIKALNSGWAPRHSDDKSHGAYGNWPRSGTQWVQYEWPQPISTRKIDVYWFDDGRGVRLPKACRLLYWDGAAFASVSNAEGLGLAKNKFNTTAFTEVTTTKLKLELDSEGKSSTGILAWRVYDSGKSPNFPPVVAAGVDRVVVLPGQTYLEGKARDDGKVLPTPTVRWSKESGPGEITFGAPNAASSSASFSTVGAYVLKLTANDGQFSASDTLRVMVDTPPPAAHLDPVWTTPYTLSSPFWGQRVKNIIVNWIPHCIRKIDDPQLREGGIENFVQAANKLAGRPAKHTGAVFANAWVYNTLESICIALMVNPQDDREIVEAQAGLRKTLEEWIPKILGAQEPDGYIQTLYTINGLKRWTNRHDHEGYSTGYFIEAAIAHSLLTGGKDTRLLDAAKRLANCWCENIGPAPKRPWFEGHEELEQALVRLARFLEAQEGAGVGRKYVALAKFLMDSRKDGDEYDQSHLPITHQYEAVGHAVRAVYCYSGLADVAMETGQVDYHSAARSLWHSIVNRKYYVTGGVGSGETAEGFGKEYSLPNSAYCESCADCGELFFQHKMQLIWQDARYADLYEETLYNAILGSLDLDAKNFTYTNPLDSSEKRYLWHVCPCCVGNIPRTILQLPSWMYSKSPDTLYVNLFAGSTVNVGSIAGTSLEVVQTTDYPWSGKVALTLNPAAEKRFAVKIRVPNRQTSALYTCTPACNELTSIAVNGSPVPPAIEHGYAAVTRDWKVGDKIEIAFPMKVQRIKADAHIAGLEGRVALRYGPLIYNFESVDQPLEGALGTAAPLSTEWNANLLGGVLAIKGAFTNGTPFTAIPNYARLNRGGRSIVWVKDQ